MATATEVEEALKAISYRGDIEWSELPGIFERGPSIRVDDPSSKSGFRYEKGPVPTFNGAAIEVVEDFGGEGQGDTRYIVIGITTEGLRQYFRKDGYYSSYDGEEWDGDFYEVFPQEKTITVYAKTRNFDLGLGSATYDSFDSLDSFD